MRAQAVRAHVIKAAPTAAAIMAMPGRRAPSERARCVWRDRTRAACACGDIAFRSTRGAEETSARVGAWVCIASVPRVVVVGRTRSAVCIACTCTGSSCCAGLGETVPARRNASGAGCEVGGGTLCHLAVDAAKAGCRAGADRFRSMIGFVFIVVDGAAMESCGGKSSVSGRFALKLESAVPSPSGQDEPEDDRGGG